jgi:hypothetical protein
METSIIFFPLLIYPKKLIISRWNTGKVPLTARCIATVNFFCRYTEDLQEFICFAMAVIKCPKREVEYLYSFVARRELFIFVLQR